MHSLLGLLLASVITATVTAAHVPRMAEHQRQQFDTGSATQFAEFVAAAQNFVDLVAVQVLNGQHNIQPLHNPRSYTVTELQNAGVLSRRFQDRNTFDQTHALVVRVDRNNPRIVEGLAMTVNGDDMLANETARLAIAAGPRAGLVHRDRPTEVWGASRQWVVNAADFVGPGVSPQHRPKEGHLAGLVIPSRMPSPTPEQFSGSVVTSGTIVPKPSCTVGTPEVYVVPVQYSDNGVGLPILGVQAFAIETADQLGWIVRLQLFSQNTIVPQQSVSVDVDANHGRVAVFTNCV